VQQFLKTRAFGVAGGGAGGGVAQAVADGAQAFDQRVDFVGFGGE
jgi:hypothetical protein